MKQYTFIPLIFEFAKGGSAPAPPPPDPMREAEARNWESMQQAARDKEQRDYDAKVAADQKAADIAKSQSRLASGYDAAISYGNSKLSTRGLDPSSGVGSSVSNLYRASLDRARGNAPEIVQDANSIYLPSYYDDAYNAVRGAERTKLNKELNNIAGDGFEYNYFADTADDDILSSILGTQKNEAKSALDRALARGQINDVGYNSGLSELGNQEKAGLAKAQQTGLGVLSGYRKNLTDYAGQQRTKVDAYDLGDDFNTGNVKNRLDTMAGGYKGSLEGDILAAIGGTNYFNTDTLLGKAGNATGVANNTGAAYGGGGVGGTGLLASPLDTKAGTNTEQSKKNMGF